MRAMTPLTYQVWKCSANRKHHYTALSVKNKLEGDSKWQVWKGGLTMFSLS